MPRTRARSPRRRQPANRRRKGSSKRTAAQRRAAARRIVAKSKQRSRKRLSDYLSTYPSQIKAARYRRQYL